MTAIRNILKRSSGPLPYIIFGPPGTGKTITLVEAMKQVLKKEPSARIIAAAPSNAAADLMAERLKVTISITFLLDIIKKTKKK